MAAAPKIVQELQQAEDDGRFKATPPLPFPAYPPVYLASGYVISPAPGVILVPLQGMLGQTINLTQSVSLVRKEDDFHRWLLHQAGALRNRDFFSLDWDSLAEELEDMAALRRNALRNDLVVVLTHMLKLVYETRAVDRARGERQWKLHLTEHRQRVNDLLTDSGTLRAECNAFIPNAYQRARTLAGISIDPDEEPVGPTECPWALPQILDESYFPTVVPT